MRLSDFLQVMLVIRVSLQVRIRRHTYIERINHMRRIKVPQFQLRKPINSYETNYENIIT